MSKSTVFRQLSRFSELTRRLGLWQALRVSLSYFRLRLLPGQGAQPFPAPRAVRPVWLRPRTTDWDSYVQIFMRTYYDLNSFPQSVRLLAQYEELLRSGKKPLIIDCGANIGLSVVWFKLAFPEAVIYAVEPDDGNFAMLQRNIVGLPDIVPLQAGVWDRQTRLAITNPDAGQWSFQLGEDEGSTDRYVAAVTIPDLLMRHGEGEPFLIKIDIEGGERQLFRSNTGWLDSFPLVIIELHDWALPWQGISSAFFAAVARQTRDYMFRCENLFCFLHPRK